MKKDYFRITDPIKHCLIILLFTILCITTRSWSDDYTIGDTSGYVYMVEAVEGCTFDAVAANPDVIAQGCCWDIISYNCDGSFRGSYKTGCYGAIGNGQAEECADSCAIVAETYADHYPIYTQNCTPDDCCPEVEGMCCPPGKPKCPKNKEGNPINVLSGTNEETETDLEFNTPHEKEFKIYRTYKSRSDESTTLGYGWTHNYNVTINSTDYAFDFFAYIITDESGRSHHYRSRTSTGLYEGYLETTGYLVGELDGSFTWHRANNTTYTFDSDLMFVAKTDGNGNIQSLTYNSNGLLETVTDEATGRSIGFVYDTNGRIDHITGPVTAAVPDGIWVSYQYDTEGNLTYVIYADDNNGSTASGFEYKYEDPNDPHNITEKRNLAGEFLSSWAYDASDMAYENITRDGKGVTIDYNNYDIIVTDAQGVEKTYILDVIDGRKTITNISSPSGCSSCGQDAVRYGYDDKRRVNEIEYANGRIDRYQDFDTTNRYHTEIQAVGTSSERIFYYTYHPQNGERLTITESSVLGTGDKETILDYDDDGNDIPNEAPTNLMHRQIERGYTLDAVGQTTAYENITTYTYNSSSQMLTVDGPLPGNQDLVSYTYDPVTGDRLTETRPLVGTTTYTYDAAGNLETITESNGSVTTVAFDGRNRSISTTRNGVTASSTYNAAGELETTTDVLNRTLTYGYNTAGFMEDITDPAGNFIYYGYNSLGQREEESIHQADSTVTHYQRTNYGDPATNPNLPSGKPWKTIHRNYNDTEDLETTYTYDASGNITTVTDANNNRTDYVYDVFNRLYQVIQPGNIITTYSYDSQGNLRTVTDAEGHATTYTYDDLGRLVGTVSPDTGTTLYSYDEAGNLRYKTQNGQTIEYQYDVLGRLTHIIYSDPAENVTMAYDTGTGNYLLGRLASVTDSSGTVNYSYDINGNLISETRTVAGVTYITGYGYDAAGNLRSITYPTGQTITYEPDVFDPTMIGAVTLNTSQTLASILVYEPFGPVSEMTLGNGITVSRTYDKNYQLTELTQGTLMDRSYIPDAVGNIELITDNLDAGRSQSFDYDDLYRLTFASGGYGTINYTYDNVGNRLSRTKTNGTNTQDAYGYYPGTNRLRTITGTHPELFLYDDDGNTTSRTPGATNPNPTVTIPSDFVYNSSGQRAQKTGSASTIYHYDQSGQLIAETDTAGNLIRLYVWLHGQPLAQVTADGSVYYYHNDHLGTPQRMTDATGAIVWAADYLPFGQAEVTVETVENNLRFAGQYFDEETGLHYNYHRYYDPKIGRYIRADPIGHGGGVNPYVFSMNNPIIFGDPSGLACQLLLKMPVGYNIKSNTNWNDWSKWSLRNTYTEGGEYPAFWLNATCICERKKTGTTVTTTEIKWYFLEVCHNNCGFEKNEYYRWEPLRVRQKAAFDTDTILLAGGLFMNETSANMACEKKCKSLNY